MNTKKTLVLLLPAIMLFAACASEDSPLGSSGELMFYGNVNKISTLLNGANSATTAGIGIYMIEAGRSINHVVNGAANIKYYTPAGPKVFFPYAIPIQGVPETASVSFVAYSPYQETINNHEYNIDLRNQEKLDKIDLLYARDRKTYTGKMAAIGLDFKHQLTMFTLNLKADGQNITGLNGLEASIEGVYGKGMFNLENAALSRIENETSTIVLNTIVAEDGQSAVAKGILMPENEEAKTVYLRLGNHAYEWAIGNISFERYHAYTYNVTLDLSEKGIPTLRVNPNAGVERWEE